ncbi:hypothetical protein NED98_13750 [Sphingomonas sp. MMSM20]|uniref:hypothetical protein n=1 Tax=Sphingomonas lycopersici TaxID=2951807 RepID=UPI0022378FBD|nr:hypothetical protein [Sphingomonas lycopersici]MCW6531307.1 hypothetical protein [Sphingomonas lycopersici]
MKLWPLVAVLAEIITASGPVSANRASNRLFVSYQTYFDERPGWTGTGDRRVFFSPSGNRFFVIRQRPELACDCNISTLDIFSSADVAAALARADASRPAPVASIEVRSTSEYFAPIRNPYWMDDNHVSFFGSKPASTTPDASRDLYTFDVRDLRLENWTSLPASENERGPLVISAVEAPSAALALTFSVGPLAAAPYPFHFVDRLNWNELSGPSQRGMLFNEIFLARPGEQSLLIGRVNTNAGALRSQVLPSAIVPGADTAIVGLATGTDPDAGWATYDGIANYHSNGRFQRVWLRDGTAEPLFDAPLGTATRLGSQFAFGFSNSRGRWITLSPQILTVDAATSVLVNAALPLSDTQPERSTMAYVLSYSSATRRIQVLTPLRGPQGDVRSVRLLGPKCLVIERLIDANTSETSMSLVAGRWRPARSCPQLHEPMRSIAVSVEEGPNEPPRLIARADGRELVLIDRDINPATASIARSEPINWTEPGGRSFSGLLMRPRDASVSVPLVILTNGYETDHFRPDGIFPSFNAQALVGAGMAVLQIGMVQRDYPEVTETPEEGIYFVRRIDAIVDALANAGIIDREKVALFGFSHGGFVARYAATFPGHTKLAAAIIDDSFDAGYVTGMAHLTDPDTSRLKFYTGNLGGRPFWLGRDDWLRTSPGMNADRLRTPILQFDRGGPGYILNVLEARAAAVSIGAPIEFGHLPYASHEPIRPRERAAMSEAALDWLRFWLQGIEDTSPAKREIYARWRLMRSNLARHEDAR